MLTGTQRNLTYRQTLGQIIAMQLRLIAREATQAELATALGVDASHVCAALGLMERSGEWTQKIHFGSRPRMTRGRPVRTYRWIGPILPKDREIDHYGD